MDQTPITPSYYPSGTINMSYLIDRYPVFRYTLNDRVWEMLRLPSAALAFDGVKITLGPEPAKRRGEEAANEPKRLKVEVEEVAE